MKLFKGVSASEGITIGYAYLFSSGDLYIPEHNITKDQIDHEKARFRIALNAAILELEKLKLDALKSSIEFEYLQAHILMINDPTIIALTEKYIEEQLKNVEYAYNELSKKHIENIKNSEIKYISERGDDFLDTFKRVIRNLTHQEQKGFDKLDRDIILISHNILPSDAIMLNNNFIKAIATDKGGKTSHTAIVARSFEIPMVVGLDGLSNYVKDKDLLIIDGTKGLVYVNPNDVILAQYLEEKRNYDEEESTLSIFRSLASETKDGKNIKLKGNIEFPEEVESVLSHGGEAIGLFRSEFLFLRKGMNVSENEQFEAYSWVLKSMKPKSVTIRTLDLGGDKLLEKVTDNEEENPLLGWRAIRFCLDNIEIFKTQLRALLKASIYGNLKIMFPMISSIEEFDEALAILDEVKKELDSKDIHYNPNIEIGSMIEVPSIALSSHILAKKCDFFSIGTNDLIQYCMAADRGNNHIAHLYEPLNPGFLQLLKIIIKNANEAGISVAMCGQMAGNPFYTLLLLGLGLDELSMSSASIPRIKRLVRNTYIYQAEELAGTVLTLKSIKEIKKHITNWHVEHNLLKYI